MYKARLVQRCEYASAGDPVDIYGEPTWTILNIACRREIAVKEYLDAAGNVGVTQTRYFLDTTVTPVVGEKLDGKSIVQVIDYVLGNGRLIGWEVYV